MDTLVNQLARELADAIAAAVADDARVEACREKARAAGLEMRVSLEAVIGFGHKANGSAVQIEYDGEKHTAANLFDALKEGYYGKF